MPIYDNLEAIRKLSNSSITSIIDITNLNFKYLSDANLEFLNNISYDETLNSFEVTKGTFNFVEVGDTLSLVLDGVPTFTIDSLGRATGNELLVEVSEAKRYRHTDFNDWPTVGIPGEIIYTGIQNQQPDFGEDFIGYLDTKGWVSLTGGAGSFYSTFTEITPYPPDPGDAQGILWISDPGYENTYAPTTQTLYYTDENNQTFDILTDPNWEVQGNDTKFKRSGKVIIGDSSNARQLKYVDGNQALGYTLISDADGNANWGISAGNKKVIYSSETLTIYPDYQYWIYGNFKVEGVVNNYGDMVIANGILELGGGGQFNNLGTGNIRVVNLSTGDSMQVVPRTFTTVAGVPLIINHGLNTQDFVYTIREGSTPIEVDLIYLNDNQISITTTGDVTNGTIVFQAKA